MGAYGCALYAKTKGHGQATVDDMIHVASFKDAQLTCHGCENNCLIKKYQFDNGSIYYSGNKCEKYFTNNGDDVTPGENIYTYKYDLLFNRPINEEAERTMGCRGPLICMRTILLACPIYVLRPKGPAF